MLFWLSHSYEVTNRDLLCFENKKSTLRFGFYKLPKIREGLPHKFGILWRSVLKIKSQRFAYNKLLKIREGLPHKFGIPWRSVLKIKSQRFALEFKAM